jgi:flagellar P-ring protein precursor FlgI
VVGLPGTGDKSAATLRMLKQMLDKKKLSFSELDLASKNVAMVAVTSEFPAFARGGDRLATTQVACIGDATSLKGGVLLQTSLEGADGIIYAVGQGPVSIGGYGAAAPAGGSSGTPHTNLETVALLTQGAIVERPFPATFLADNELKLKLRNPDFTTAARVVRALREAFPAHGVSATDAELITLSFAAADGKAPDPTLVVAAIDRLQQLRVEPDLKARVVINSRTGTVVAGSQVRISAVAVSHGGLSLRVQPRQVMIDGKPTLAWKDPATNLTAPSTPPGVRPTQVPGTLSVIEGITVEEIANGLNALGARPRDLMAIFQAIHSSGALHAELVEM